MAPSLRGLSPCLDAPSHARRTGHGPGLGELQAAIRAALLGGDAPAAAGAIAPDGIAPEARLDIYRHHVRTTLTAALEATFPAVVQLVDRRFFAYAADAYIRAEPPAGPCLGEYGRTFPAFLASFPPCRHLAYLPDVARLEWAMSTALHAEDREPLEPAALARVAPDDLPRLVFALDPSAAWIESAWPVDRIWRAARDEAGADVVDVSAGGARLEIRRIDGEVALRALPPADHALRAALAAGATLERAAEAALASDPGFDLAAALGDLLHERILVGCAVSN